VLLKLKFNTSYLCGNLNNILNKENPNELYHACLVLNQLFQRKIFHNQAIAVRVAFNHPEMIAIRAGE